MTPTSLVSNILAIFILLLPFFGKQIDFVESVIFYSLPPLLYLYLRSKHINPKIPKKIANIEIILLTLLLVSTLHSQNVGTSYYRLMTYTNCVLIFNLCLNFLNPSTLSKKLPLFSCIYSCIFIAYLIKLLPISTKAISDNFIKPIWGHSYLADFLIFPITIMLTSKSPKLIPLLFLLIVLGLTNSRSALLSILPVLFLIKNPKQHKLLLFIPILLFLVLINTQIMTGQNISKSLSGNRLNYYSQAIKAFTQKPILGWGPANFSLVNSIFKETPGDNTAYAHNFLLNSLTENGLLFTLIFYFFIIKAIVYNFRQKNKLFFYLSLVSIIHSCLDPTWQSPAIFILSLYFIFYPTYQKLKGTSISNINLFLVVIIFIFFLSKTISDIFYYFKKYQASLITDPFNLNTRLVLLDQNQTVNSSLFLYPNNTSILSHLISVTPFPKKEIYIKKLVSLDPQSIETYLTTLGNHYQDSDQIHQLISFIDLVINKDQFVDFSHRKQFTANLYLYSLDLYSTQPDQAILIMDKTVQLVPEEGHFHIDLANMYWHTNQIDKATNQLQLCLNYPSAQLQCQQYNNSHYPDQVFDLPGQPDFINYFTSNFNSLD